MALKGNASRPTFKSAISHYDCVSKLYFEYNGTFDKLHLNLSFLSFHVSVATGRTGDSRVDR